MKKFNKILFILGGLFLIERIFLSSVITLDLIDDNAGLIAIAFLILFLFSEAYLKIEARKKKP